MKLPFRRSAEDAPPVGGYSSAVQRKPFRRSAES